MDESFNRFARALVGIFARERFGRYAQEQFGVFLTLDYWKHMAICMAFTVAVWHGLKSLGVPHTIQALVTPGAAFWFSLWLARRSARREALISRRPITPSAS